MSNALVLSLSGNDIFSGGGLTADLATYTMNGLHGFVAVTCLTALTEKGFEVIATSSNVFKQQLDSLKDVPFSGIKIGLLPNPSIAKMALEFVKSHQNLPIVLDPVLVCKEKHDSSVVNLRDELLSFFPYVTIVTPNLIEAEILTGKSIETLDQMIQVSKELYEKGASSVIIKGGNRFDKDKAVDVFYDGRDVVVLEKPISLKNNVGAGCTFASSIISQLIKKHSCLESTRIAKEFVYQAIQSSHQYGVVQNYEIK